MAEQSRDEVLEQADALRGKGDAKAAIEILQGYAADAPDDAEVALMIARGYDSIGQEREGVTWYERALANDLDPEDAIDAGIGLGSSLRSLGEFDRAVEVLTRTCERFPDNRAAETFLAMARFNAGEQQAAFETLLRILAVHSADQDIRAYSGALTFYAEDISATW